METHSLCPRALRGDSTEGKCILTQGTQDIFALEGNQLKTLKELTRIPFVDIYH